MKTLYTHIWLILLASLSHTLFAKSEPLSFHIQSDFRSGRLSEAQALAYQIMGISAPERLPVAYQADIRPLTRRGTELRVQAQALMDHVSGEDRALLQSVLQRPNLPLELVSPNGLFKIHYATSGTNAATLDFVRAVAFTFDDIYDLEVTKLGFWAPPVDTVSGPQYDVYIQNLSDYGSTTYDAPVPSTTRQDFTSWIQMDNDFTHTPTKGYDAMRVTAAHEFFHMIQLGYRSYHTTVLNSVFLYEATASWMEDEAFDEVNDYYFYLTSFFRYSDRAFHLSDGLHEYGLAVFFKMLSQKYGAGLMKQVWEQMVDQEPFAALDRALALHKSNFPTELGYFAIWNCYTSSHADTVHYYKEGKHYPELTAKGVYNFNGSQTLEGKCAPMVSHYYQLEMNTNGGLVTSPSFTDSFNWLYACVEQGIAGDQSFITSGSTVKALANVRALSTVWVIPIYHKRPESNATSMQENYTIQVEQGSWTADQESKLLNCSPNPFVVGAHENVSIEFSLAEYQKEVNLYILTEQGEKILGVPLGQRPDGANKYAWDGRNSKGELVVSGIYLVFIDGDQWLGPAKIAVIR